MIKRHHHSLANGVNLEIRRMTASDLESVLCIEKSAHSHAWSKGNFQGSLDAGHQCWVVEIEEEIAAYAIVSHTQTDAELLNLTVTPQRHREGIGAVLLAYVIVQIESDAETLFLEVRQSNRAAIGLYDYLGFNEVGVRPNYYPAKKQRENALIFAKSLCY